MTELIPSTQRDPRLPGLAGRWRVSLTRPEALLPILGGGACLLLYMFFSQAGAFLLGGAAGLALGGLVGLARSWSRASWAARHLPEPAAVLEIDPGTAELARLRRALSKLKYEANVEKPAEQASDQVQRIRERFSHFEKVLASKMQPGELTYQRYLSSARGVRDSVTQNLGAILLSLQSLQSLGMADLEKLEWELSVPVQGGRDQKTKAELEAVRARIAVRDAELARLGALLTGNETAIARIDEASLAVGGIRTSRDPGPEGLETALEELRELASRASKYSS